MHLTCGPGCGSAVGGAEQDASHTARALNFGVGLASRGNKQNARCEMTGRGKVDVKIGDIQISSSFDSGTTRSYRVQLIIANLHYW